MVRTTGNSSGNIAMASARAESTPFTNFPQQSISDCNWHANDDADETEETNQLRSFLSRLLDSVTRLA
jgi:hypothetical protein